MTEKIVMVAGKSCYVPVSAIVKIEAGQRGLDWMVIAYLNTKHELVQANTAYLAGPFEEERLATEACDRIVAEMAEVISIHRGGMAHWAWHDDTVVRT